MAFVKFIVEPSWLEAKLESRDTQIRVVDGTWLMPGATDELSKTTLPNACSFDLDKIAAPHATLKHMLPSRVQFEGFNRDNAIQKTDHIICYDRHGLFSSPRLWWTYRMFGHEKVSVLNGGLPAWLEKQYPVTERFQSHNLASTYKASTARSGVIGFDELQSLLGSNIQIIDARPAGRFNGTTPEPRPGLRSGHMPGAISLPFEALCENGRYKDLRQLAQTIGAAGISLDSPIITTCGSGITATGLALIFHQLGARDVRVYDGSWAEWGASKAPLATTTRRTAI